MKARAFVLLALAGCASKPAGDTTAPAPSASVAPVVAPLASAAPAPAISAAPVASASAKPASSAAAWNGKCVPLPWKITGHKVNGAYPEFVGKLAVGNGTNANGVNEKPYVMQPDRPLCGEDGTPIKEIQIADMQQPSTVKSFVGKHVKAIGDFDVAMTAHHHRPIVVFAESIAAD